MPNYGTYAICPYFVSEDMLSIRCEGIVQENNATNVMRFKNSGMKKTWLKRYCESYQYGKCPYASILESAYDDLGQVRVVTRAKPIEIRAPVRKAKVKDKNIKGQLTFKF